MSKSLLFFIFFYCSLSPMKHSIIDDQDLQAIIINYCTAESNKNTDKQNIFDCIHSVWRTNKHHYDLAYLAYIYRKIYQASHYSIHNASLQTININSFTEPCINQNVYTQNPLNHGVSIEEPDSIAPNVFSYNQFKILKQNNDFTFNQIFDGPNDFNQWIFSYSTNNQNHTLNQSFFLIASIQNPTTINQKILSKPFNGIIKAISLNKSKHQAYIAVSTIDKETNNAPATMLYDIFFSFKKPLISFNKYMLPIISPIKKLIPISSSLLLMLSEDGTLHKIDIHKETNTVIDILDIENKKIGLDNIIINTTIPYLWLLVSKKSVLYLLNLKNKNQNIRFSKITDEFNAKNIWFDIDYILAQDESITVPIEKYIEKAIPLQYSLYKLYMILAKTTFSELSKDNNNVK